MPETYRALIVILILSTAVFALVKPLATAQAMSPDDFIRRRNYWYYITIAGFLSPHFWVYIFVVGFLVFNACKNESNKIALFFFIFLAMPQISERIPGFGVIEHLFSIDYIKLLIIIILIPLCIQVRKKARADNAGFFAPDIFILSYLSLSLSLQTQYLSNTEFLRSVFMQVLDVLVPYYAISRSVRGIKAFRDVLMSFVIAAMLASSIGFFEFIRSWLLYSGLSGAWGVHDVSIYLLRADLLRAVATSGHAISFGYVVAVAVGLYLYLWHIIPPKKLWICGLILLTAGVISPLSKGPWTGLAVMLMLYMALSPERLSHATRLLLILPLLLVLLFMTDTGTRVINFLPFVGTVDAVNVTYRQDLFDTSIQIILDNPLFGSTDYSLKMEHLRQGQGIIDLVNTFLIVALNSGLVGLALFVMFFATVLWGVYRTKKHVSITPEVLFLGNSLFSALCGIMIILATFSPIFHATIVYIAIAGLGVAYQTFLIKPKDIAQFPKHI